jgi:hemophore-related protein
MPHGKADNIMKRSLIVAIGGLAVSLTAGAGVASADPIDTLINSTCTYQQAVAALNAESPDLAAQFNAQPMAKAQLRQFIAMNPDQRRASVQAAQSSPLWNAYIGPVMAAASNCANF